MKRRLLSLLLVVCLAMALLPTTAVAAETAGDDFGNGFHWSLDDSGTLTITGTGDMPNDVPWEDKKNDITKVKIGEDVTSVRNDAFNGCASLTGIELPASVTSIGERAFSGCTSLTQIELPAGVKSIGTSTFISCVSLTQIKLPASVESIGESAFTDCISLKQIELPASVKSIGEFAFSGCSRLAQIELPANVTSIGMCAFESCSDLTELTFTSEKAPTLGRDVFWNCNKLTIYIPENGSGYDGLHDKIEYFITINNTTGGTASASTAKAKKGESVTITAEADSGYHFKEWKVVSSSDLELNDAGSAETSFSMPVANVTIEAIFERYYSVTVENDGNGKASASPASAAEGMPITLTATANSGYHFKAWEVISGDVTINNNSFVMPAADVKIKAIFAENTPVTAYSVTVENDGNGTASASRASAAAGTPITLTAKANSGYHFKAWEVFSGGVTINNNSFVMPAANVKIKAIFAENTPPVTTYSVTVENDGNGTASASPDSAAAGTPITLTAKANSGYHFQEWQVISGGVTINNNSFVMPAANVKIKAIFAEDTLPSPTEYTVTVKGSYAAGSGAGNYAEGATVAINAGSRGDYTFSGWTTTSSAITFANAASPSTTFVMPAQDVLVTANWVYNGGSSSGGSWDYTPAEGTDTTDKTEKAEKAENSEPGESNTKIINPFADVKASDWFYDDVLFVYNKKIMTGTSDNTFSPYGTATRGMMAAVIWRMEGSPKADAVGELKDVPTDSYYADAVNWAVAQGIFNGYGDGIFAPDNHITREQLAAIFYNYAKYKGEDLTATNSLAGYADQDSISDWARNVMEWAVGRGLISGRGDGILDGQGTATRAEIAAMLHRLLEQ